MASPQTENGHIDIANDLAEAFFKIRISGCEWQLLWVIIRKTYGWHKKQDFIALSQFHEMTDIPKPDIIRNLKKLLGKKIISVGNNPNKEGKSYGINKDFDKWEPLGKKITIGNNPNKSLGKKIPTKENYTKEKIHTFPLCPHQKIVDLYHQILPELTRVKEWNNGRRGFLNSRWKEKPERQNLEWWENFFSQVKKSDFLMGKINFFKCDLEWLIRPNNFIKVLEGKYDNKDSNNRKELWDNLS
jgi:phage replication O-like protein O